MKDCSVFQNKIISYILTGLGIGSVCSLLSLWAYNGMDETLFQFAVWLVASALFGLVSLVYEVERFSLLVASSVHLLGCAAIALTTSWLLGYSDNPLGLIKGILPGFLIIYGILYGICYLSSRSSARKLSEKLQ